MLRNDYSGAAVVTSVDVDAIMRPTLSRNRSVEGQLLLSCLHSRWWKDKEHNMIPDTDSHLPFALLGEEGWRTMDPFLPIEVTYP